MLPKVRQTEQVILRPHRKTLPASSTVAILGSLDPESEGICASSCYQNDLSAHLCGKERHRRGKKKLRMLFKQYLAEPDLAGVHSSTYYGTQRGVASYREEILEVSRFCSFKNII